MAASPSTSAGGTGSCSPPMGTTIWVPSRIGWCHLKTTAARWC
uniref:Uncharacterized protein n=1 Tax=Arundo donax TaxID=35708 RepID=A0A0A9EIE0_ARUDO